MQKGNRNISLGRIQHQIVQFLWEGGQATAREITDHMASEYNLSHSTIQTLLRRLELKGAISHFERDRVFVFEPVVQRNEITESSTREFLSRVFQGSAAGLVSHVLEHESFSREELDQLRAMIDAYKQETE